MTIAAICPDCGKRFRVPHARKEWHCKACDGVLVLEPPHEPEPEDKVETEAELDRTTDCPACGAKTPLAARFCEACGAEFGATKPKRRKSERSEVRGEMRSARKALNFARGFLNYIVAFRLLALIAPVVVLWRFATAVGGDYLGPALDIGLAGVEICLLLLVVAQFERRPFPAALTLALYATVSRIAYIAFIYQEGTALPFVRVAVIPVTLVFLALYWWVTFRAARLTRLAEEYPDLLMSRAMRGDTSRSIRARHQNTKPSKVPYILMGVVLTAVGAVLTLAISKRPGDPEPSLAAIMEAWNERDVPGMAAFVREESRESWIKSLERVDDVYGWGDEWPIAGDALYEVSGGYLSVELLTEAGRVPFRMEWEAGRGWRMNRMSFSEVRHWKR